MAAGLVVQRASKEARTSVLALGHALTTLMNLGGTIQDEATKLEARSGPNDEKY